MEQAWIASEGAAAALAHAMAAPDADAMRLGPALERAFDLTPEQRAAVLTQVDLQRRAAARWGDAASGLLFTRDGLEQASRPAVARWRAHRLRDFGVRSVADLGCGLGLESRAFAATGMDVIAVEIDPHTAALGTANLRGTGVRVVVGDATDSAVLAEAIDGVDAVFLDPARRDPQAPRSIDGLSGHRITDPERWSPPWSWIERLAEQHPRTVVKVAPGIEHTLVPEGGSAVWTAVDGDLVEASIWFPGFERQPQRAALSLDKGSHAMLDSTMPTSDIVRNVGNSLLDVAPVVTRSGLVTTLACSMQAARIDEHIGYLTCDHTPAPSPFVTPYRVLEVMPFDRKRVGAALASFGCGALTVMKRGFAGDTEELRRHWIKRCTGSRALTVALTRIGDAPTAIICER